MQKNIIKKEERLRFMSCDDLQSMSSDKKSATLIEAKLSYDIIGILMKVHSGLGSGHHERYYQRASSIEFEKAGIKFSKELKIPFEYRGRSIGRYFLDFLIEEKIPLEFKVAKEFSRANVGQLLRYLRKSNKQLGMLVNFGNSSLEYKRVINNEYKGEG